MTIRDIAVAFGIEVDQKSVGAAENAIKGVKNMASKLLGAIGIGFSIAGIANLAEAAADAEALKSQFSQVFGDLEQDASDKLDKIADDTGVTVNRMKGSFTQIAAFAKTTGMEQADALDIADRSMKAVADSAAFYDRSIEDVTNSLQSFLKGNFENDAALGLSCTETTRNTAANALYGKSFKDLSEAEKQLTLLQMVEDANKASGAIGQAARESDTWTNQLGNLKQNVQDLKAAAGNAFLKPAVMVLKLLNSLVSKATVGMKKLTSETGILTKAFNGMHALVKRLKPAIDRMMQTLQIGAKKGMGMVKNVIDKLGGVDNALKLLAIIAGAFFIVMNWSKIISGAKAFITLLTKMKGLFSLANLKTLAIVAAVVLLALIVEDFINFLLGNDSVIGTIFDKLGIGADNARQAVFDAFNNVKNFLSKTWQEMKVAIEKHGGSIKQSVQRIFGGIFTIVSTIFTAVVEVASKVFGGLGKIFKNVDLSTPINAIVSTIDVLLGVLGNLGEFISNHAGLVEVLVKAYGAFKLGSVIVQLTKLTSAFALATAAKIKDAAETVYINALYAKDFVLGIKNTVVALASQAKAFAASMAAKIADKAETIALQAMYAKDFVASIASSTAALIKQAAQFAINTAAKAADAVAQGAMTAATLAWNVAAAVATTVTTALGAAMAFLTSPIGLVILAITALIAIGVLLYKNWDKIKEFASSLWEKVSSAFQAGIEKVKAFMNGVIEFVKSNWQALLLLIVNPFAGAFKLLYDNCEGFRNFINQFLETVKSLWETIWGEISSFFQGIWNGIASFFAGIWNNICSVVQTVTSTIQGVISSVFGAIRSVIQSIWNAIASFIRGVISGIASGVSSTFNNILSSITNTVGNIKNAIVNGFNAAIAFIKGLPSQAVKWGADFINGLKNGIMSGVQGIVNAVKGIGDKIKSFLHFSVPDEGPLTDYESWMPDFMGGLAEGISSNEDTVLDKVKGLAGGISTLMKGATASAATATGSAVNNTSNTTNVTQNNTFNNSYSGSDVQAQQNVSKGMKQSAQDATSYMAKGLAYAR